MAKYSWPLPSDLSPTGTRIVPVPVPDDDEWAAAFAGHCFDELAKQSNWNRDETCTGAKTVADRWEEVNAMFSIMYLNEVEEMTCEDVQDCIETSEDIQQTIVNIINTENNTTNNLPIYNVPYQPLPDQNYTQNQVLEIETDPSSCTDEATFGAALEVVQWIADDIQTFFDLVEVADDPAEVMSIITGAIGLPPASILQAFFDLLSFMSDISPQLWDFSNSEVTQNRLACAIWCNWKDCNAINIETVYETVAFEFDDVTGRNVLSLTDLISIIEEITSGNLLDYGLFTGFITMWSAFIRFIQRTPFGAGFKTPTDWKNIMRVGYLNGDAGYVNCDPCAGVEPCNAYTMNFTNLGIAGLPNNWMNEPPPNWIDEEDPTPKRWANTRPANQPLRAEGYPQYGLNSGDFVRLGAAYELPEQPCRITRIEADANWATTLGTKGQSVYALIGGYDWDNRMLLANNGCSASLECTEGSIPNLLWQGELDNVTHIAIVVNGGVTFDLGAPRVRFLKVQP